MAQTLSTVSLISFAAAGLFFVLAVFFLFFFNILTVIGDLTGYTARRSIAKTRTLNEKSGNKQYSSSKTNKERGKLTYQISEENKPEKKAVGKAKKTGDSKKELVFASMDDRPDTGLLESNKSSDAISQQEREETSALNDGKAAPGGSDSDGSAITELLTGSVPPPAASRRGSGIKLTTLDELILVHTDEVID